MKRRKNILIVVQYIPKPDASAGGLRLLSVVEMMAKNHHVDVYIIDREASIVNIRYRKMLQKIGVNIWSFSVNRLELALARRPYDIIILEFWMQSEKRLKMIRKRQPWSKVIVDSVDVHFLREEAALTVGKMDEHLVISNKRRELAAYRQSDGVIVVTEEDRQGLESCGDMPPLYTVPIVLPERVRNSKPRQRELLFVGGFNHLPNIDAVEWLSKDIWPLVKSHVPEAKLTIAGSHPPDQVLKLAELEDVEVTGYVPETAPFLDRAALSVAPLRYGAGMKGKVAEAMAAGLPVVTTSVGSQGFGAVPGEHCMIADSASDFAAAVVQLLKNPEMAESIGTAGQRLVAGVCGPEVVAHNVQDMIEAVSENQPAPHRNLKRAFYIFYDYLRAAAKKLVWRLILQYLRCRA